MLSSSLGFKDISISWTSLVLKSKKENENLNEGVVLFLFFRKKINKLWCIIEIIWDER